MTEESEEIRLLRWVVILVTAHSVVVGGLMLFFPRQVLDLFHVPCPPSLFFPSQSGLMVLLLALGYVMALLELPKSRRMLFYAVLVKAAAFIFLMIQWLILGAPLIFGFMGLSDGAIGLAVYLLARRAYHESLIGTLFGP